MLRLSFRLLLQLTPSMAIYDTMQSLQSPIGTHCVGYAYNLAGFLLAAGEKVIYVLQNDYTKCNLDSEFLMCFLWSWIVKGHRFAMPLSRIALESPAGAARGQVWTYVIKGLQLIDILFPFFMFIIFIPNDAVQADDIQNEANELLRIRDYLFKELAQKTGQPVDQVTSFFSFFFLSTFPFSTFGSRN